MDQWQSARVALHAPTLMPYEWASGVAKALARGTLGMEDVASARDAIVSLGITYHAVDPVAAVGIARALQRRSAYDAAYLALAAELGAQLWTLDGPLYGNAVASGFDVRLFA